MIELDVITEKEDVELWISLPDYTNVGLEYGFKTSQIIERNFKDFKEKLSRKYIESYKKRYKEKINKKNLGNHYLINNNYEFIQNKKFIIIKTFKIPTSVCLCTYFRFFYR